MSLKHIYFYAEYQKCSLYYYGIYMLHMLLGTFKLICIKNIRNQIKLKIFTIKSNCGNFTYQLQVFILCLKLKSSALEIF